MQFGINDIFTLKIVIETPKIANFYFTELVNLSSIFTIRTISVCFEDTKLKGILQYRFNATSV